MRYGLFFALLFSITYSGWAQQVTVSKEISTRTDYAYEILGQIGDRILLYRDKGNEKKIEVFDESLKYLYDREIRLKRQKSNVYSIVVQEEKFSVFSGFRKKGKYSLYAHSFDKDVHPLDTVTLIDKVEDFKLKHFTSVISNDRSKTLLFGASSDDLMHFYVIDNDSIHVLWSKEILVKDFDVREDYQHAFITNEGEFNVLFYDRNKESKKGEHQFLLLGANRNEDVFTNKFIVYKKYIIDIECRYDDRNNRIVMAGLASEDQEDEADSYFFYSNELSDLDEENGIEYKNFDAQFITEVYGEKLGKKKRLDHFITRDVIVRNDGGIILVTEMEKEFYRRSSFNSVSRNRNGYGRGWVDLYNEDIILISINKDGTEDWKKILYKKQFAQDDDGVFSSFYIFKNPSRIRLIYNDEIKNNITVSEYVLDPLGRHERNSLLSTEYQNLKLRWKDAIQISPTAMLIPSEKNTRLSLVKVDYAHKS